MFRQIGLDAGKGFAEGMQEAGASMAAAAGQAASAAIEAARLAVGGARGDMLAGIFEAVGIAQGGRGAVTRTTGLAGMSTVVERLLTSFQDTPQQIRDATAAERERTAARRPGESAEDFARRRAVPDAANASVLDFIGESGRSLNINTAAGAANVSAIFGVVAEIRDFVTQSLQAGVPIATVIADAKKARDQILAAAKAQGLDISIVQKFLDQMGLSNAALAAFQKTVQEADAAAKAGSETTGGGEGEGGGRGGAEAAEEKRDSRR